MIDFGLAGAHIAMARAAYEAEKYEEKLFHESISALPSEAQCRAHEVRREQKEKRRLEAQEERRHQEIVAALRQRSTPGCQPSGGFALPFVLGLLIGNSL